MRRFELSEGSSNKFWAISRDGNAVTTRWGRIGTDGQEKTKAFANEAAAQKEYDALLAEKTRKGYREVTNGATKGTVQREAAAKAAPATTAPKAAAKAAAPSTWRRFEFSEGSSNKFWEVSRDGTTLATRWGRIGASGRQEKSYVLADSAAAQKEYEKAINEKTRKGYRELGGAAAAASTGPAAAASGDWAPVFSGKINAKELVAASIRDGRSWGAALSAMEVYQRTAVSAGTMLLASSDGKTFRHRTQPNRTFALRVGADAWYAGGESGAFAVSRDRGETWKTIKLPHQGYVFSLHRDATGGYWMGGDDGVVLRSDNLERGWKKVPAGLKDKVLGFCDLRGKVFIVGSAGGVVWDGQKFKKLQGFGAKVILTRIVAFEPSGVLLAVGDDGLAFRSTDEGKSFKPVKTGVKGQDLEDCAMVAGALFVVGGEGTIRRSTDEGKSFQKVESPTSQKIWSIASWGDGAFLGCERGALLKLASPKDAYWRGATDEFAPAPPSVPAGFTPLTAAPVAERTARFEKLFKAAELEYTHLSSKAKASRPKDANPGLAAAVDAGTDANAMEVYADWLASQGDPRGELAAVQRKLRVNPKDKALKKAESELLKKHEAAFLGNLKGFGDVMQLTWRDGFIFTARISNTYERYDGGDGDEEGEEGAPKKEKLGMAELVGRLLDHPSGRFLHMLTVGMVTFEDNSYSGVIKELSKRFLPSLRVLFLGDFESEETELSWSSIGNTQPMYGSLPNLDSLKLRSGSMTLGDIVLPKLRELVIETGGLSAKSVKSVAKARTPSLENLSLYFGQDDYGGDADVDDIAPILEGATLPRLKSLGILNCEFIADVVKALPKAKILPQLDGLDLSLGTLSDDSARVLASYRPAFAHLKGIDLRRSYLSKEGIAMVTKPPLCADVGVKDQRDDDGDPDSRYAAVGE